MIESAIFRMWISSDTGQTDCKLIRYLICDWPLCLLAQGSALPKSLTKLTISHNAITSLSTDFFTTTHFTYFDISFNNLTSSLPLLGPSQDTLFLNFEGQE